VNRRGPIAPLPLRRELTRLDFETFLIPILTALVLDYQQGDYVPLSGMAKEFYGSVGKTWR
jgi:hypothetical protein